MDKDLYAFFGGKHPGVDFDVSVGTPIHAALPGYVTSIEYHRGMGKVVRMRYGSMQHIYGHLSSYCVCFGEYIEKGEIIGKSGDTISWIGPHLHFELRDLSVWDVEDRPVEPKFSRDIPEEYREKISYVVTSELALIDLSLKFFGSEDGVRTLKMRNPSICELDSHDPIPQNTKITISSVLHGSESEIGSVC